MSAGRPSTSTEDCQLSPIKMSPVTDADFLAVMKFKVKDKTSGSECWTTCLGIVGFALFFCLTTCTFRCILSSSFPAPDSIHARRRCDRSGCRCQCHCHGQWCDPGSRQGSHDVDFLEWRNVDHHNKVWIFWHQLAPFCTLWNSLQCVVSFATVLLSDVSPTHIRHCAFENLLPTTSEVQTLRQGPDTSTMCWCRWKPSWAQCCHSYPGKKSWT